VSESTPQPGPDPEIPAEPPARPRERGARRRGVQRWTRRALAIVVAVVAALIFTVISIDIGRLFPGLRGLAEREASKYLERPAHIGRISALLVPGDFAIDDVVIEGRRPDDRPFMRVKRVIVHLNWWPLLRDPRHPQIHVQVRLVDWQMVVETWAGGVHNVPKLTPKNPSTGPKSYTTTVDYAFATNGHFIYDDHATPWSVDAPNLNFALTRSEALQQYVGRSQFTHGAVRILGYQPMATEMTTRFVLDGPRVQLQHIDLKTDGSLSHVNGLVDFSRWPEQTYYVNSDVDFGTMRGIFFPTESWRVAGNGHFTGAFRYAKDSTRELAGDFTSDVATINDIAFPHLHGSLIWTNSRFAVTHAESDLLGGQTRFEYGLAPLGTPGGATATFAADYSDVDLFSIDRLINLRGLHLAGIASGNLSLEWQNGRFGATRRGGAHTSLSPPPGIALAPVVLPETPLPATVEPKPFDSRLRGGPLAVGGDITYQFDPGGTTFEPSWAATPHTYVSFGGRMGHDGHNVLPFAVTSHDWQESDRVLAAIMTAVSGPTGAIEVGGRGTFNGRMTGAFSSPRIEGHFTGEALRVWDVTWGRAAADLVIENKYVDITHSLITGEPGSQIVADGRYALGFRNDDAEEIRAHVRLEHWPLADLRHAFTLDDWPVDGTIALADLDLRGRYKTMYGSGPLRIDQGHAWHEGFDVATGDLTLEGTGLRIGRIDLRKGSEGVIQGAARIGWDGTYDFSATGGGIDVETLDNFKMPSAPLSGRLTIDRVSGAGTFAAPRYSFDGSISDLFVGDEGIGPVAGRFTVNNDVMSIEYFQIGSSRATVSGVGTIAFDPGYTSDLRVRFQTTALDPYLKFVMKDDISPYTRILVGGLLSVHGPLADPKGLVVDARIDDAKLTLSDYDLTNDGPVQLQLENGVARIAALKLKGNDTNLAVTGRVDTQARTFDVSASGDASLSILQFKLKTLLASGAATLDASLTGSFDAPKLTGRATIADGRLRPFDSPHSVEALNGRITFGTNPTTLENAITLDDVTGRIGNGDVRFGGTIALDGYRVVEYNLTAQGRSMRLRYPDGFSSTVNMNLFLTGPQSAPRLAGSIDVLRMAVVGASASSSSWLGLLAAGATDTIRPAIAAAPASTIPVTLNIQVRAPRMAVIDTKTARVEAAAELAVGGTFDVPTLNGDVDIVGGRFSAYGNQYFVREGTISFHNSFDPIFDVAAEIRPRLGGQTYVVDAEVRGTPRSLTAQFNSDPYLPQSDIISLLFGATPEVGTIERRTYALSQEQQQRMIQTAGATLLATPLTSIVGSVVERTGALDTVQITPLLTPDDASQQLNPTARVTLGKRISPRVYLTYSRTLSPPQDEVILLEYEQSDLLSWVLSRNEDRTFALDFRLRYVF
jgi:hypothetical protein